MEKPRLSGGARRKKNPDRLTKDDVRSRGSLHVLQSLGRPPNEASGDINTYKYLSLHGISKIGMKKETVLLSALP